MIFLYLLAVYGLTNIIVEESIFRKQVDWLKSKINFLDKLLSCSTCFSFYVGVVMALVIPITITGFLFIDILLLGLISSGAVNIIEHLKTKMI